MRVSDLDLIFIPATGAVSPDHWIARWSAKLSTARLAPALDPRATPAALIAAVQRATRPTLLIGYSTGAIAAALAAPSLAGADCRGAFLVAPPDDDTLTTLDGGLWPQAPRERLPWPSVLVASRTDPWSSHRRSLALASDWGADFVDAGESGRIDADSGHGPWPDGLLRLGGFLKKLG
ncbi:MAG: alpha/beta hydrolase [Pseudomonadota bacterium]|nr:alpha/beta hydrolase [Pseudomonadota bacterium]